MNLLLRSLFFISVVNIFSLNVFAQGGLNIYGAKVRINSEGNIYCNENVNIKTGGDINNSGTIRLKSDWVNDSGDTLFIAGVVNLSGDTQEIGGTDVTSFDSLELSGTGRKELARNTFIDSLLKLNDRELFTDTFSLIINNTDSSAISRTSGFVSSDSLGELIRYMADTIPYLFPVGSNEGTDRYRPIDVVPINTNSQSYAVRFINNNPAEDGYNGNERGKGIVGVNTLYYHEIKRYTGAQTVDMNFYYDRSLDGEFNSAVNWMSYTSQWESLSSDTATDAVSGMVKLTASSVQDTSSGIFAISKTAVLRLNTEDLSTVNYQVSGAGLSGSYQSGGEESLIPDIPLTGKSTITVNVSAGADNDSMKVIFDMDSLAVLSNVRAILYDTTAADTFSLDSSFHKIIESRNLYLVNGDSLVVGDSAFAGALVLENGLLLSPNNDDSYDELEVTGLEDVDDYELNVHDLENNLVFTTTSKTVFWNGKYMNTGSLVAKGVYKYEMQLDSRTITGQLLVNY